MIFFSVTIQACGFAGGNDRNEPTVAFRFVTITPASTQYSVKGIPEENVRISTDEPPELEPKKFSGILGLNELSAYRANFTLDWTEVISDESSKGYLELSVELTTNPDVAHTNFSFNQDTTVQPVRDKNSVCCIEMYRLSGNVYKKTSEDNTWTHFFENDAVDYEGEMLQMIDFPKTNVCNTRPEMVNGVSTIHCSFTQENMVSDVINYDFLRGDVWTTVEGYIVKYTVEAKQVNTLDEPEARGTYTLEYNATDINGDFSIILPEEIKQMSRLDLLQENNIDIKDIPVLDNAERVKAFPNTMTYYTPTDVASVIDFYRQELLSSGWEQTTDLEYTDYNNIVVQFERDGNTLGLNVGREDGYTLVLILLNLL